MNKLLAAGLLAALVAPAAWAHAVLKAATPASGAAVPAGVHELRLTFNEPLEAGFCKIQVTDGGAKAVAVKAVKAVDGDPTSLVVPLEAAVAPGTYTVRWSAMGHDGHRTKGDYKFTVK